MSPVLRETLQWGAFACLLVPVVLVWSGTPVGTALLTTAALAVLGVLIFLAMQASGMALTHLEDGPAADEPARPEAAISEAAISEAEPQPALEPVVRPGPALSPALAGQQPGQWYRTEPPLTYEVEAGWADDDQPALGETADPADTFGFPLFRDERPDTYR